MGTKATNNSRSGNGRASPPTKTSVGAAVCFALYGMPQFVVAQQAESTSKELAEITVTATRREQTLESIPYNISVVSGDELARTGVTDIATLARQVPGLSYLDFGARQSGATVPIIRGINASETSEQGRSFRNFEQSPVGTYIGNSPFDGYLELDDINRVEVLRGPQGTLYGAGALGGALRIIPNNPELGKFSGSIEGSTGHLNHSSGVPYGASAMLNIPLGETLAFRAAAKFDYEPGYIDAYGLEKRTGDAVYGAPVLANPADPVNSSSVFYSKKGWNDQNSFTGRASLLWKPNDKFSANLAFIYANVNGDGGPVVNSGYPGGPYILDPRITFPSGGKFNAFSGVDQQFWRRTTLSSVDLSFDAGFATLSSTSSYSQTTAFTMNDGSYGVSTIDEFQVKNYYGGLPVNPRFISPSPFTDTSHTFDQEIRLVSNTSADKKIDYVVGLFYENQTRVGGWYNTDPGSPERAISQGCTALYYYSASFPNCLISHGPGDSSFVQVDTQTFTDKSEFGELTWHFIEHGQITAGFRHFQQDFTDAQSYLVYTYNILLPPSPRDAPASKNTWKVNPSYEYRPGQFVYAIWSQGFRRGGANAVPLVGIYKESPLLQFYQPDSVNNYEAGVKGRFDNGFSYTFSIFDIHWDKPQISATLPDGNLAVYNANSAISKGFEFEARGPLFIRGLSYLIGGSYTDATLSSSFSLPANIGGVVTPGGITGQDGQQLPGSPKTSVAATLTYDTDLAPDYALSVSLNGTYKSTVPLFLSPQYTQYSSSAYALANLSGVITHEAWSVGMSVTNLFDKYVVLYPWVPSTFGDAGGLERNQTINQPRQMWLTLGYKF